MIYSLSQIFFLNGARVVVMGLMTLGQQVFSYLYIVSFLSGLCKVFFCHKGNEFMTRENKLKELLDIFTTETWLQMELCVKMPLLLQEMLQSSKTHKGESLGLRQRNVCVCMEDKHENVGFRPCSHRYVYYLTLFNGATGKPSQQDQTGSALAGGVASFYWGSHIFDSYS